jgi:hypothetical protein
MLMAVRSAVAIPIVSKRYVPVSLGITYAADDVCLAAGNAHELQAMLSVLENYANRENYAILVKPYLS